MEIEIPLSFSSLSISTKYVGKDMLITVQGGDRPHIGTVVLALPRPSLRGDESVSTTSSLLNVTGHKDEALCRILAEKASKKYGVTVVCTGGFHVDNISAAQIQEVIAAIEKVLI